MKEGRKCSSPSARRRYNWLCRELSGDARLTGAHLKSIYDNIQNAHQQSKSRLVYLGVTRITDHNAAQVSAVNDKNGVVLRDPKLVKARWKEHFEHLYNPSTPIDCTILDEIEVSDHNHTENAAPLLRSEVENAIKRMKGRTPGIDNIAVE